MLGKISNITDIPSSTPNFHISHKLANRFQGESRCESATSTIRRLCLSGVSSSSVLENQLLWMFNRRRDRLIETSAENLRLYRRIHSQRSSLSKFNKNRSKLGWNRIGVNLGSCDKENINVNN
jgi:hypothetical protein